MDNFISILERRYCLSKFHICIGVAFMLIISSNAERICCEDVIQEKINFLKENISSEVKFYDLFLCTSGIITGLDDMFTHGENCMSKQESNTYHQTLQIGFRKIYATCKLKYFTEIYYVINKLEPAVIILGYWSNLKLKIAFDFTANISKDEQNPIRLRSVRVVGNPLFGGLELRCIAENSLFVAFMCWFITMPNILRYIYGLFGQIVIELYLQSIVANSELSRGVYFLHCLNMQNVNNLN